MHILKKWPESSLKSHVNINGGSTLYRLFCYISPQSYYSFIFWLNLWAILVYRLVWLIEVNAKGWAAVLAKGTLTNSKITYELFSFIRMKDVTYMNVLLLNWFEYALQRLYKEGLVKTFSWNHWGCICKILFASCFKEEYCVKSC